MESSFIEDDDSQDDLFICLMCNFGVNFQSVTVVCHQGVISKAKLST